jgi:hypothetical protein
VTLLKFIFGRSKTKQTVMGQGSAIGVILPWGPDMDYLQGQPAIANETTWTANDNHTSGDSFDADQAAHWTVPPVSLTS